MGHSRSACPTGMADRTPKRRASYEALETTERRLADRQAIIDRQQETIARTEAELSAEQEARAAAEQREAAAMDRLRELALVRHEADQTVIMGPLDAAPDPTTASDPTQEG